MGNDDVVSAKEKIEKAELTIDRFDAQLVYPITKMRRKRAVVCCYELRKHIIAYML